MFPPRLTLVAMKTSRSVVADHVGDVSVVPLQLDRPSLLHLVSTTDTEEFREALLQRKLPPEFEAKLSRLAAGDLLEQFVAQNCRTFFVLLLAVQGGSFEDVSLAARERLLRVLAYVRKEEDAIADYKRGGFVDDLQEVRSATADLNTLLQTFKEWRLRHQVPHLWT